MIKFIAGFVIGFIIATVGVTGIATIADKGVSNAKETLQQQSAEASAVVQKTAQ